MTRYDVTCDAFAEQLADYLEGDASEPVRAGVEAHAAGCAPCAALLADLVALPLDARSLPALAPARDLWSGIAERIDARVLPMEGSQPVHRMPAARRRWSRPAMAAAALVLVTAGVTNWVTRASMSAPPAAVLTGSTDAVPVAERLASTPPVVVDGSGVADAAVPGGSPRVSGSGTADRAARIAVRGERGADARPAAGGAPHAAPRRAGAEARGTVPARLASAAPVPAADRVYDRDITALRRIVRERSAQLDPATVAVLEQSVAVIDSAIAQSRSALARDPASRFLATQLNHSLEKKIELLRTAAMLPART